jgi:prepilin-type processing-associated H-X9-DG protein/prepilin-type N-terminal cleavage/methylation domain-containing protein
MPKIRKAHGFTFVEILVALVVIGLIAAILLPIFLSGRESARRATCVSNIRQLGSALMMYTQDNDGYFIPELRGSNNWDNLIAKYLKSSEVFRCPSASVPSTFDSDIPGIPSYLAKGYALNFELYDERTRSRPAINDPSVIYPSTTVAFGEVSYKSRDGGYSFPLTLSKPQDDSDLGSGESYVGGVAGGLRHQGGSNYVFVDGHVKWYKPEQVLGNNKGNDGNTPSFAIK